MPTTNDWLLDDDENGADAAATATFVENAVYDRMHKGVDVGTEEVETRRRANVQVETIGRLQAMGDKAERALIYHTARVVEEGIYHYSDSEPDSIKELLANALDASEINSSEWHDLTFLVDQLIPYMITTKIPNAAVLWARGYKKKARAAVPLLRHYFANEKPAKLEEKVRQVIGWIVDPKITKQTLEDKIKAIRGISPPTPIAMHETVLPNNRSRLTIECSKDEREVIVRRLKGLVDVRLDGSKPKKGVGI
jgi:hypothetical protein